jgi:gamma-glutamyltranspeptidase/glutathione hydrolase
MKALMATVTECLCGASASPGLPHSQDHPELIFEKPVFSPYTDDERVDQFVEIIRTAELDDPHLLLKLNATISASGWKDSLSESILHGIEAILKNGAAMGEAMTEAVKRTTNLAREFAERHPVYAALIAAGTIIAIGVLVIMGPGWVLEALGFAARGPRLGEFVSSRYDWKPGN